MSGLAAVISEEENTPMETNHNEAIYRSCPKSEASAYSRGWDAASNHLMATIPYLKESAEAKAFEHGYQDGQKVMNNDRPPGRNAG